MRRKAPPPNRAAKNLFFRCNSRRRDLDAAKAKARSSEEWREQRDRRFDTSRLILSIDQSTNSITPLLDLIKLCAFTIRSMRLEPVAGSRTADVYLQLESGSATGELGTLMSRLKDLPGILSARHDGQVLPAAPGRSGAEGSANEQVRPQRRRRQPTARRAPDNSLSS